MKKEIYNTVRCNKCNKPIAIIYRIETDTEYQYKKENLETRYIDKWGFERNFCKKCMK